LHSTSVSRRMSPKNMSQGKYDGVVFDMDGTLVEPLLDFPAIRAELGLSEQEGVLEAIAKMPSPRRNAAEALLLEHELSAARSANLLPGAEDVLTAIRRAGLKTALLTRNTRRAVEIVLRRFPSLQFDLVFCREDGPVKPAPDGVHAACRAMGVEPARTVCVGDYRYDIMAARTAGAVSVLITTLANRPGFSDWSGLADHRIDRLDELPAILGV
jgi:HAD superfamily hydrolase (TIGR01509 family)